MQLYQKIADLNKKGTPLVLVNVIEKKGEGPVEVGKKMIVTKDNKAWGTVGGGALEYTARNEALTVFSSRKSFTKTYLLHEGAIIEDATTLPMACGGIVTLFFEYIGPQEFVYIFGAGHVGQALTNVLKTMNFHVTVIDERQDVIAQFVGGDHVVHKPFVQYIEEESLEDNSFVVVCTPSHKHDYNVLHAILQHKIPVQYMGMLCSIEKLKEYMDKTQEIFGKTIKMENFYSPIGLDIGGGSPEEIAISITAEILAVSHGKQHHNHMRELNHDPYRYWED